MISLAYFISREDRIFRFYLFLTISLNAIEFIFNIIWHIHFNKSEK